MLDLTAVKLDARKLDEGSWWSISIDSLTGDMGGDPLPGAPGDVPAMLIVPIGIGFQRVLDEEREPFLVQLRDKKLSDTQREEITAGIEGRAIARKVLRGWANLTFGGEAKPWSEDLAADILSQRAWRTVRQFVLRAAGVNAAAAAREEEQAKGN